jgi:hypothetical protein
MASFCFFASPLFNSASYSVNALPLALFLFVRRSFSLIPHTILSFCGLAAVLTNVVVVGGGVSVVGEERAEKYWLDGVGGTKAELVSTAGNTQIQISKHSTIDLGWGNKERRERVCKSYQ